MTTRTHDPSRSDSAPPMVMDRESLLRCVRGTFGPFALAAVLLAPMAAAAANLSVSPGSGAGGRVVQLTASGFDLEGIGVNTGFYVDGAISVTPSISGLTSLHDEFVAITIEDGDLVTVPEPDPRLALAVAGMALFIMTRGSVGSGARRTPGARA